MYNLDICVCECALFLGSYKVSSVINDVFVRIFEWIHVCRCVDYINLAASWVASH